MSVVAVQAGFPMLLAFRIPERGVQGKCDGPVLFLHMRLASGLLARYQFLQLDGRFIIRMARSLLALGHGRYTKGIHGRICPTVATHKAAAKSIIECN